jgi:methyl-accepting chemotaxis protein
MIRDFFLLLLLVAAAEFGIRYLLLRLDFSREEPARVARAAQQLADDVRAIMLNSGGPLAARTVYPILDRNYGGLGLAIAVVPAAVTVESMKATRNMDAQGLPARWPAGEHQQASVTLTAEQFCLGCHVKAQVGDVLGTVTVRSYLERKEQTWWQDLRLTAGALSLKLLIHTVLLFLLLKVRMEPLLALRSTVSQLSRGVVDLSPRADVNTEDEFGTLAQDLNHFLDRIAEVVRDLDKILSEVVAVGTRLSAVNRHLEAQLDSLRDKALRGMATSARRGVDLQLAAARESGAFDVLLPALEGAAAAVPDAAAAAALRERLADVRQSFQNTLQALRAAAPELAAADAQSAEYQAFAQSLREMAMLEATMQAVAESGQQLLQRLTRGQPAPQIQAG